MKIAEIFEAKQTMFEIPDSDKYVIERKTWNAVRVVGDTYKSIDAVKKAILADMAAWEKNDDLPSYNLLRMTDKETLDWRTGKPSGQFNREYIGKVSTFNPFQKMIDPDSDAQKRIAGMNKFSILFHGADKYVPF